MDQPPTSTRESSADMKAKWESNPVQGPSIPFFGSSRPTDNTGQTMEQFEKNTLSNQFNLGFPSHQQPVTPFFPENKARDIKPCNPRRTQSREKKKEEEKNEDKKKPILTEHKLPSVDVQQQTEEEERPRRIQRGTLARCFQAQEESLAGIYLEIEKECSITECYKLKSLNLSRQGITALNDLNLYFPVLERLKLSHNELTQLSGLPESLCYLYANDNKLTSIDLTHLGKLQHLYLSHNHLSGFDNLSELKLLRKLDIGHNFIKSVRSFQVLEGLTHLYLKSNNIHRLKEFEEFNSNPDLEYLDISFNRIEHLESMESLTGLIELNIDHNDIKVIQLTRPLERLCKLRLSFNRLKSFDMSLFPDIRVLYLDDNQIERIMGAACTRRMESFSLRDQGKIKVEINIKYLRGARKLYLSGSPFRSLRHMVDFYSLKYLELCTADIEELPIHFSKQMPNLATLYLSTNRIADIRPLRKLKYLQRLILIDNRITSLNEVIAVVKQLKNLNYLDLRQNPISTSLYNPLSLSLLKGDHRPPLDDSDNKSQTSNSPYVSTALDSEWQAQDGLFLQSLNDHWKMRRKVYRSLLLLECPKLIELDHIQIHDLERSQAPNIIHEYSSNQNSNPASSSHGYSD
ncbi:unnamed protein product [Rhizopus stolonifer]